MHRFASCNLCWFVMCRFSVVAGGRACEVQGPEQVLLPVRCVPFVQLHVSIAVHCVSLGAVISLVWLREPRPFA